MRVGICGDFWVQNADGSKVCLPEVARTAGFDYLELPLSNVAALSQPDFDGLLTQLARIGLPCEACNVMFPRSLRLTGPAVDGSAIEQYLHLALGRAGQLGVRVVVFGSAGARNAPQGFPLEQAFQQLIQLLRLADPIAAENGLCLAIEPLNSQESNLLNTGAEGYTLARLVDRPNIGLLLDAFHMALEEEDPGVAVTARRYLRHAHFADPLGRVFPRQPEARFRPFFAALRSAGYDARVSLEAGFRDLSAEAPQALAALRQLVQS